MVPPFPPACISILGNNQRKGCFKTCFDSWIFLTILKSKLNPLIFRSSQLSLRVAGSVGAPEVGFGGTPDPGDPRRPLPDCVLIWKTGATVQHRGAAPPRRLARSKRPRKVRRPSAAVGALSAQTHAPLLRSFQRETDVRRFRVETCQLSTSQSRSCVILCRHFACTHRAMEGEPAGKPASAVSGSLVGTEPGSTGPGVSAAKQGKPRGYLVKPRINKTPIKASQASSVNRTWESPDFP